MSLQSAGLIKKIKSFKGFRISKILKICWKFWILITTLTKAFIQQITIMIEMQEGSFSVRFKKKFSHNFFLLLIKQFYDYIMQNDLKTFFPPPISVPHIIKQLIQCCMFSQWKH